MRVTTVRFSEDLWATVQAEAEVAGVSASQFIREAALARAAAAAGARGDLPYETAPLHHFAQDVTAAAQPDVQAALSVLARAASGSLRSDSEALRAESRQVRRAAALRRSRHKAERAKRPT
jgi:hypothetical protein